MVIVESSVSKLVAIQLGILGGDWPSGSLAMGSTASVYGFFEPTNVFIFILG